MSAQRQVALLRGINVGGNNMIAMAGLRDLMGDLGYADVKTHLQSGNVVFTAAGKPAALERAIAERITKELGLSIKVLVRSRDQLAQVVDGNPFQEGEREPSRLLVGFCSATPDAAALRGVDPAEIAPNAFRVAGQEIYFWCPGGVTGADKMFKALSDKRLKVDLTARNWNTVMRLLALADVDPPP